MGALMRSDSRHTQAGFSLVELLVVMVIMGLVMTSVYGLYLNSQKTSITSEEVIDVQQNLRIAYDTMARDLRMAGFSNPQGVVTATGDNIEITTASPFNRYARILRVDADAEDHDDTDTVSTIDPTDDTTVYDFIIPEDQAQFFRQGHIFRICRPQNGTYIPNREALGYFVATSDTKLNDENEWYISLRINTAGGTSGTDDFDIEPDPNGDMLARVFNGYYPYDEDEGGAVTADVVAYELVKDPSSDPNMYRLMRRVRSVDGVTVLDDQVLATKIHDSAADPNDGLRLGYVMADGFFCEPDPTVPEDVTDCDTGQYTIDDIIAVQVHLTGSTDAEMTGSDQYSGVKKREVLGRVHIKNRTVTSGT